ncbi:hypothetical protein [Pseudomonas atacamensis]|nr:hypothetical protein [Pseudomonas atacamensis]WGT32987.1 hypothetical protein QG303_21855 [Pseudomonas atacamensis]
MTPWSTSAPLDKFTLGSVWAIQNDKTELSSAAGPVSVLEF